MAERQGPKAGLTVHSNLARSYSARASLIGHAERTAAHIQAATAMQQAHWGQVENHLDERGIYG